MALSSTIVWEVQSAGADTNGGGFKTGASGTDWTITQTGAKYGLTTATTVFATDPKIILDAAAATDMVGNVAQVISGTNSVPGFYEILSVVAGVSITVDANVCTGNLALGVINIGGPLKTIGKIGSATANLGAVAGNLICVKADAGYTIGATDTMANAGTATNPVRISGYSSTRPTASTLPDAITRTNGNGALITTSMPAFTYSSTFKLNITGTFIIVENINILNAATGTTTSLVILGADSVMRGCKVANISTANGALGIACGNRDAVLNCDVLVSGSGTGTAGITIGSNAAVKIIGCRINCTGANANGITFTSGTGVISKCTIFGCGVNGIASGGTTPNVAILDNTIVGNIGDGINIATGSTTLACIVGNMITDNTGDGLDMVSTSNAAVVAYNRYRDNANSIANGGSWISATKYGDVDSGTTGTTATDYTNYGSNDYSLIASSPATSVGIPLYASIGALQRAQNVSGETSSASSG